jgi:hypothetical protein
MSDDEATPSDERACSHEGCETLFPKGKLPEGWTVARVEFFMKTKVVVSYYYLCPSHILTSTEKQVGLFV